MQLRKGLIASAGVLALFVGLGSGVASAGGSSHPTPPPVSQPGPLPAPTAAGEEADTGWINNTRFAPVRQLRACWGADVTIIDKYDRTQVRFQTDEFNSVWLHERGTDIIKLKSSRYHKSVTLDNSGDFALFVPDLPDSFVASFTGKSLLYPRDDTDRATLASAGLPKLPYLKSGKVTVIRANGIERVVVAPGSVIVDACTLLNRHQWDHDHDWDHDNPPVVAPVTTDDSVVTPPCLKVAPVPVPA